MNPQEVTDGTLQPATASGPVGPILGLPIAALTGGYELQIELTSFSCTTGAAHVRIVAEDGIISAGAFTNNIPVAEWGFQCNDPGGSISPGASITLSMKGSQAPGLRIGVTNAALRFNVVEIDGTGAAVQFNGRLLN